MAKDLRLRIYPAIIALLGFSLVALMLSRLEIQVSREPAPSFVPPAPDVAPDSTPVTPQPTASPSAPAAESPVAASPTAPASPAPVSSEGGLRVSNQTAFPIRVALLYQDQATEASDTKPQTFGQPVHWDFAPEEGEAKGLTLSLPNSRLRLQTGDVLVAFAQDGSRRYWGPYVVGKTAVPTWSAERKEWSLILRP